jgi:endonuclease YncB( thermonuclease family)
MQFFLRIIALSLGVAVVVLFLLPALFGPEKPKGGNAGRARQPQTLQGGAPASLGPAGIALPVGGSDPEKLALSYERATDQRFASIETGHAVAVPPPPTKRYFHVVVKDAGTLQAGNHTIRLGDIEARGVDAKCTDAKGHDWPCGTRARFALMHFIRDRAVVCTLPPDGEGKSFSARCRVGNTDLSLWMVQQGWARYAPQAGPALVAAESQARANKVGIWGRSD